MRILIVGKRHYTHKDALKERFGRIYRLPLAWSRTGCDVRLELVDYRSASPLNGEGAEFAAVSRGALHPLSWRGIAQRGRAFRPEVVVASGDCFVGLAAYRLARHLGARFVFDIYDDYRSFAGYRLFAGWDAYGYLVRRADTCWFASRRLLNATKGANGVHVPNGVDPTLFRPIDPAACRAMLGLPRDARIVGYFGSLEVERGVDDLVEAVARLHATDPSLRLLLAGGSTARTRLAPTFVVDEGNVSHCRIPTLIGACDVVALPYRRGPVIDAASSLKMSEYLFCRRPIVATRTPSLVENFPVQAVELADVLAMPSDPASLAVSLRAQLDHPRIATVPEHATWDRIAALALASLKPRVPA